MFIDFHEAIVYLWQIVELTVTVLFTSRVAEKSLNGVKDQTFSQ